MSTFAEGVAFVAAVLTLLFPLRYLRERYNWRRSLDRIDHFEWRRRVDQLSGE